GNYTALVGSPSDCEWLPAQARITVFFHGAKESVQVKMQDFSRHFRARFSQLSSIERRMARCSVRSASTVCSPQCFAKFERHSQTALATLASPPSSKVDRPRLRSW